MERSTSRILFASPHSLVDFASGAAVATIDLLQMLDQQDCDCRAFCGSMIDGPKLEAAGRLSGPRLTRLRGVPVHVFETASSSIEHWGSGEAEGMLGALNRLLDDFRPDVLLTYGGDAVAQAIMRSAKSRGIAIVFGLHNFAYHDAAFFRDVDWVLVPSQFARMWYERRLSLGCSVLPYVIDWQRVGCQSSVAKCQDETPERSPSREATAMESGLQHTSPPLDASSRQTPAYLSFVNPQPTKGLFVFARMAEQLQRRRPDIPILVVESRGAASWLEHTNVDLSGCPNLHAMENTPDPRDFYAVTKLLLVPSLWNESFGLVAAEAMMNGIPVLASSRGALPETLGARDWRLQSDFKWRHSRSEKIEQCPSGSFVIDIPEPYTPETTAAPTAEEVEPWVETIIRLWDDEKLYRECSEQARAHAQQWHPDRLGPIYAEFFRNVRPQPGPPIIPREGEESCQLLVVSGQSIRSGQRSAVSGQLTAVGGEERVEESRGEAAAFTGWLAVESSSPQPSEDNGDSWGLADSTPGTRQSVEAVSVQPSAVSGQQAVVSEPCAARPAGEQSFGLTSIVIVTHNQIEYTKLCIESVARHTSEPYELIFVDNGSSDGTVEWLKSIGQRSASREGDEAGPDRVTVVANSANRGFPAAANQGIRAAAGRQIVLLNNDTIVTRGWLARMLRAMYPAHQPAASAREPSKPDALACRTHEPEAPARKLSKPDSLVTHVSDAPRASGPAEDSSLTRRVRVADDGASDAEEDSSLARRVRVGLVGPVSNFVSGRQQIEVPYGTHVAGGEWGVADQFPSFPGSRLGTQCRVGSAFGSGDTPVPRSEAGAPTDAAPFPGRSLGTSGGHEEPRGMSAFAPRKPSSDQPSTTLEQFAHDWAEANDGRIEETDRLVGFCLLIRREVIDRVGLLDERFGIGNFEDDDYCRRAREAGFRLVIARDAFVHHFGGRTFIGSGIAHGELMRRNEQLYREKWSGPSTEQRAKSQETANTGWLAVESSSPPPSESCVVSWGLADSTPGTQANERSQIPALGHEVSAVSDRSPVSTGWLSVESSSPQPSESCAVSWGLADSTPGTQAIEGIQLLALGHQRSAVSDEQEGAFAERKPTITPQASGLGPRVSLCMIARDNERTIGAALETIRHYVDDIVVVDTGSTDRTAEIAANLGARVFRFDWCDDFSAARNESIRHALGQWIFWMDTDDVIDEENARKMRDLVARGHPEAIMGYLMKVRCPTGEGDEIRSEAGGDASELVQRDLAAAGGSPAEEGASLTHRVNVLDRCFAQQTPISGFVEVDQVKLFRNLPKLRFEFRIHEQVLMSIRRAGGTVAWTDIFLVHANSDQSPDGRAKKLARDLRLLELERQDRPDHPFTLFNLGMTLHEAGRLEEAVAYLWQSIGRAGDDDSHLRKTYALLVSSYRQLGRHVTAWEACGKGLERFPDDPELRFRQAVLLRDSGNLPAAARAFEDLLGFETTRRVCSVDGGLTGYRARHNLAAIYAELGNLAQAERHWRAVIAEAPHFKPARLGLAEMQKRHESSLNRTHRQLA